MPTNPGKNESESEFMARCIKHETGKGHPHDQAVAMCISMWNNAKGVDGPIPVQPGKKPKKPTMGPKKPKSTKKPKKG